MNAYSEINYLRWETNSFRQKDARHTCGTCEHCDSTHRGDFCKEMTEHLVQNGFPAVEVKIDHSAQTICEYYVCDEEEFRAMHGEYPKECPERLTPGWHERSEYEREFHPF